MTDQCFDGNCPETGRPCATLVPLREHMDTKLSAIEKSTSLAASALEARLANMNEWRGTLRDQLSTFTPRAETVALRDRVESDLRVLRDFQSRLEGKASGTAVIIANAIAILSILISIVGLLTR